MKHTDEHRQCVDQDPSAQQPFILHQHLEETYEHLMFICYITHQVKQNNKNRLLVSASMDSVAL